MLFTGSNNIDPSPSYRVSKFAIYIQLYNYIAAVRFNRDLLKILIFNLKNLSSPTFSGVES